MTNVLEDRRKALLADLLSHRTAHERLDMLMDRARKMPSFEAVQRTDERRVEGCVSALWMISEFRGGACYFRCDSDSLVVKSIAGLLCDFYSGAAPADILAMEPTFLRDAGITAHLTSNRRNALSRVGSAIRAFAQSSMASA